MPKKEKKEKAKKSKAQWPTWKAPFQPGSNLHSFCQTMMKKGGLTAKEFTRMIKKTEASPTWLLKCLRKGHAGGWIWEFDDSHDRFRITNVKLRK